MRLLDWWPENTALTFARPWLLFLLLAIPLLGEWPAPSDWIAMLLISGGIYVASAGLLRLR